MSLPGQLIHLLKYIPFLAALRKKGRVMLLASEGLREFCRFLKPKLFDIIYYNEAIRLFSEPFKRLKKELDGKSLDYLIELNHPANLYLPYLINPQRRITFYEENYFPYYNILIKGGIGSLIQFLGLRKTAPGSIFQFRKRETKRILKGLDKKSPLLFINGDSEIEWDGSKIVLGRDIPEQDPLRFSVLFAADAYYGKRDGLYEFARLFNKRIV